MQPEGVSGRVVRITDNPTNAVFNLQGTLGGVTQNELKVGYNSAPTNIVGQAPVVSGIDFGGFALNLSGSVANTGIAGQGIELRHRRAGRPGPCQQRHQRPCPAL